MNNSFKILLFSALLVLNFSCNQSNQITIINTNFGEEVSLVQNLVFRFNESIILKESEIGILDKKKPIIFEPEIPGNFTWTDKNEVLFSPSKKLEICKDYIAKINTNFKKIYKTKKKASSQPIKFHTPYLNLVSVNGIWGLNESTGSPQIKINTEFNYEVAPKNLLQKLKVSINDEVCNFNLVEKNNNKQITIFVNERKAHNNASNIKIEVEKGLSPAESSYQTDKALVNQIVLSSPYVMSVNSVNNTFENQVGTITVNMSQEIDPKTLNEGYSIEPKVKANAIKTENGFEITGEFLEQESYTLVINKKLKGILGGTLTNEYNSTLMFGKMPPSIQFSNSKAQYISNKGNQNIGLNIVNIEKVNLKITKIFQNNILQYLNNNRNSYWDYYEDEEGDGNSFYTESYGEDYNGQYGQEIVNKEIYTKNLPKSQNTSLLNVNLNDEKKFKGVYLIHVRSESGDYNSASKLVSISDLGLLTKRSKNDLLVLVNSIYTSEPVANVEVSLISRNNQNVYTLKTDNNGVAHFTDLESKTAGFEISMVTANLDDDFNYMLLNDNRVETARFETDGIQENNSGWWAYIYPERNIYRPGETIHFNTIIRGNKMENISNIPVLLKLISPSGNIISEKRLNTNEQGAVANEFATQESFMTGTYSLYVYDANDVLLNSVNISIEEFVPDKIKVITQTNKPKYELGQDVVFNGEALTFFGPPSANRNYDCEFSFKSEQFYSEKHPSYRFNIKNSIKFESSVSAGKTDEKGQFSQTYKLPEEWKNTGLIKGSIFSTVFDENNRPVNRYNNFEIHTQKYYFGINRHETWVGLNAPMVFNFIALDKDKKLVNVKNAVVEIIKVDWQNVLENYYGSYRYNSKPIEKTISSKIINISNGKYDFTYIPKVSGEYKVRIKLENSELGYSETEFYAYYYGSNTSSSFEVDSEGEVIIETDKPKYSNKDEAKLLFKTPFNGKLLVSVERNKVFEYHTIETKDKTASININLSDESVPNVYISATLIKKMSMSDMPLTVAHGLKNIQVIKEKTDIPVQIIAPESSRSNIKQSIKIKTVPNAQVTIAIVDEGILSIKNFQTPNPFNYFYQKRALSVSSYDLYAKLFPEMSQSATGGDGYGLEKRVNPLSTNRFKPISIWSGILKANGNGEINFEAQIPKFYGAVRIMAVAYLDEGFGAAEKEMKVFDPIVMSSSLPRFLTPKDEIEMTVNLTNTTQKTQTVSSELYLTGPLNLIKKESEKISIAPGKEGLIHYYISAKDEIGKAKIKVKVNNGTENFIDETEISVRPAGGLLINSSQGFLKSGETVDINVEDQFIGTPQSKIIIDHSPLASLSKNMMYLVRYPHGCLEQTISAAFPQIYFPDMIKAMGSNTNKMAKGESEMNPTYNVNQALSKLNNLVNYDGNMSYWNNYYSYSLYLNAYTLHFIVECEKNGYAINQNMKSRLIAQCSQQASSNMLDVEYINENEKVNYISREKIYTLYVLALAGSPNKSAMNYCKMSKQLLFNSNQYVLASSFALIGDMKSYKEILPKTYLRENNNRYSWYDFSSPIKDKALVLNALLESNINTPQVHDLAKSLVIDLKQNSYYNTNELAYGIIALGKYGNKHIQKGGQATVLIDGKNIGNYTGNLLTHITNKKNIKINGTGSGSVYYSVVTEGISNGKNTTEIDNGIVARRQFYNRKGEVINPLNIKQNDLIVVKLSVSRPYGGYLKNIALTDILPAGLEIENPRITITNDLEWMNNQSYASNMDIRDDRINYFFDLYENGTMNFYYMCRAVSKGKFILGNVQADAMYDGSIHSYNGKGTLIVN